MFNDDDGQPCGTCRTVHEPYANEVCSILKGEPSRHGYEMYKWNGCTCPTCYAGCVKARARARYGR